MDRLPELKRMRAGSLTPELYGEISEFFSSVHPDITISGRTSLFTIYSHLMGARERLRAKRLRRAEELIRAICAAADTRELEHGKAREGRTPDARKKFTGKAEQIELKVVPGPEMKKKFGELGITDGNAMARVLSFLGEAEFLKRQKFVLETLPERAYRAFFKKVPDFLQSGGFYDAVDKMSLKVLVIDNVSAKAPGADYRRNPEVLLLDFSEINEMLRIVRRVDEAALRRLSDPEELRKFAEGLGFSVRPGQDSLVCFRQGQEGKLWRARIRPGMEYGPAELAQFFMNAGITGRDMARAGIVQ